MRRMAAALVATAACATVVAFAGTASFASPTSSSADWTQYRYDVGHSGFNPSESTITTANAGSLALAWDRGPAQVNVLVGDGRVYSCGDAYCAARALTNGAKVWQAGSRIHAVSVTLGGTSLYVMNQLHHVLAVDRSTGVTQFQFGFPGGSASPPTYANGVVYLGGPRGHIYAVDATNGNVIWSSQKVFEFSDVAGAPTLAGGYVVSAGCGNLYALRASNGGFQWAAPLTGVSPSICGSLPAASGNAVYVTTSTVSTYDATTGALRWSVDGDGGQLNAPAVAYRTVYVVDPGAGTLNAYDASTGRLDWSVSTDATSVPTVANNLVYVAGSMGLSIHNAHTGALVHEVPGNFSGEPVVSSGSVVVGCNLAPVGPGICTLRPTV